MFAHMIEHGLELVRLFLALQQFDSLERGIPKLLDQGVQQHQEPGLAARLAMRIALVEITTQQTRHRFIRVPGLL